VQRWSVTLNEYNTAIIFVPGKINCLADFLSRAFDDDNPEHVPHFAAQPVAIYHDLDDESVATIRAELHGVEAEEAPEGLSLHEPPPKKLQEAVFVLLHGDPVLGNFGPERTICRASGVTRWPGMENFLRSATQNCPIPGVAHTFLLTFCWNFLLTFCKKRGQLFSVQKSTF